MIHPEFCTEERAWCYGEVSAPTIRELLTKLPPGTEVQDYFPAGRAVSSDERGFCVNDLRASFVVLRPKIVDAAALTRGAPPVTSAKFPRTHRKNRKHDYEAVLTKWVAGYTSGEIAAELHLKRCTVYSIVDYSRRCGDKRAMCAEDPRRIEARRALVRGPSPLAVVGTTKKDRVLNAWAAGMNSTEISTMLGDGTDACRVTTIISNARNQEHDPRALGARDPRRGSACAA